MEPDLFEMWTYSIIISFYDEVLQGEEEMIKALHILQIKHKDNDKTPQKVKKKKSKFPAEIRKKVIWKQYFWSQQFRPAVGENSI